MFKKSRGVNTFLMHCNWSQLGRHVVSEHWAAAVMTTFPTVIPILDVYQGHTAGSVGVCDNTRAVPWWSLHGHAMKHKVAIVILDEQHDLFAFDHSADQVPLILYQSLITRYINQWSVWKVMPFSEVAILVVEVSEMREPRGLSGSRVRIHNEC